MQRIRDGAGGCHLDLHVDTAVESLDAAADRARAADAVIRHTREGLVIAESPGGFVFCLVKWDSERAVPPEEFDREVAFWAALTGQERHPAPVPGYAYLTPAPGWPIRLLLQRRDAAVPGDRTRAHVDFGCTDAGAQARHVAHGARVADAQQHWTVLTDPAGRVYCLVNRDPR